MDLDLTDLSDFLDGKRLILPANGKKYVIAEASGEQFLRLQRYGAALNTAIDDADNPAAAEFSTLTEEELSRVVLGGDVFDQMIRDDVLGSEIARCTRAAFYWHIGQSAETVRAAFEGQSGKARAPRKRAPKKAAPTTRGAAANTTTRRASGNGGRSPQR